MESAVWSVLAKSGLLSERERLPTRSLVFVLLPQGYRDQDGTFRLEAEPGEPTQQVWFKEVCLWKEKPEAYNYLTNPEGVRRYWEERVRENGPFENLYTLGMRGIHDSAIQGPKSSEERIRVLERLLEGVRGL